jgi:hypothetical protein
MRVAIPPTESGLAALFDFTWDTGGSGTTCLDATRTYSGQYTGTCAIADRPVV